MTFLDLAPPPSKPTLVLTPTSPSTQPAAAAPPSASASPTASTSPAENRSTEFKAVEGGAESRSGGTLMVEAYAVLWLLLLGWITLLWRKQNALHARLDDLERAIDKASEAADKKSS